MHCWWMRSFIWGEGNEKIVWCSRQVDPQWLTVMLPVRQAHAMRLSSWRQINFSPNSPPLLHNNQPDSFSSNSFFVAKLMTAYWYPADHHNDLCQESAAPCWTTHLDHIWLCCLPAVLGVDLCSLSPVKPGPHYLISPSLRRHNLPSLKSGWVTTLLQGKVDKQSPGYALNKNCRCSSLAAVLNNCLVTFVSHIQKHIKVLQFCFTLTVAFKEPFYHSFL